MSAVLESSRAGSLTVTSPPLRVKAVGKRFGGLRVFDDLSFELPRDTILGVIGPNGAGKTTLINVLCGMLAPTAGRIFLGEREITGKPLHVVSRLGIARTFQQTNSFGTATVEENLYRAQRFGAANEGAELYMDELLEEFDLARHLHERSDMLPYGVQKMLGLIMALATRPRFLLMDEPAAGLERRERKQIDRFVEHARKTLGCGILLVEHDMDLVRRLCPHILVLESGRLLAEGAPADVLSRPEVIEAYLGTAED